MPSIEDVADQINAKLDAIANATEATATATSDILGVVNDLRALAAQSNDRLAEIRDHVAAGFPNLSMGLFALVELHRATNHLLDHQRELLGTIICELVNGNDLLCGITRKLTLQLAVSDATLTSIRRLEGIAVRAQADAAGDYDRALELRQQIDACCPPPEPEPEPCPERCDLPRYEPRKPDGQEWEPLPPRDVIG